MLASTLQIETSHAIIPMPELSRFFGIIIRMFMEIETQHHVPHFHAYHGSSVGIFSIEPVELIVGDLPRRQQRFVEAWAELHQMELKEDWALLQSGKKPRRIAPLS